MFKLYKINIVIEAKDKKNLIKILNEDNNIWSYNKESIIKLK